MLKTEGFDDREILVAKRALKELKKDIKNDAVSISKVPVWKDKIGNAVLEAYNNKADNIKLSLANGFIHVIDISTDIGKAYFYMKATSAMSLWDSIVYYFSNNPESKRIEGIFARDDLTLDFDNLEFLKIFIHVVSSGLAKLKETENKGQYCIEISGSLISANPVLQDQILPDQLLYEEMEKILQSAVPISVAVFGRERSEQLVYNLNMIKGVYAYIAYNNIMVFLE